MQQKAWSPGDDVTVVDDGPVEIRQLLKPYVFLLDCLFFYNVHHKFLKNSEQIDVVSVTVWPFSAAI